MAKVLITAITERDGSYPATLVLEEGYEVGLVRPDSQRPSFTTGWTLVVDGRAMERLTTE